MTEKAEETVDIVLLSGYDRMAREMLQDALDILSGMYSHTPREQKLARVRSALVRLSAAKVVLLDMEMQLTDDERIDPNEVRAAAFAAAALAAERETSMCVGPESAYLKPEPRTIE